jgi:hypothetical protein
LRTLDLRRYIDDLSRGQAAVCWFAAALKPPPHELHAGVPFTLACRRSGEESQRRTRSR